MRFFTGMGRKALVRAAVGGVLVMVSPAGYSQTDAPAAPSAGSATALPLVTMPAGFRNQPADAIAGSVLDPALGEAELARLIALTLRHSPVRAQAAARVNAVRPGFLRSGEAEKRAYEADLARLDELLAEEIAHAWFDGRAADARLAVARVLDALAAQGLQLVNQRVAAGLATQADLERIHESAIRARALAARAAQERGAAVARIAALSGEQVAGFTAGNDAARMGTGAPGNAAANTAGSAAGNAASLAGAIHAGTPSALLERADVRAARLRADLAQEQRHASAPELAASYRETVLKALEETENAYAMSVNARAQRSGAGELAATAARQTEAVLAQLEAGRIGRLQHVEAQLLEQDARLRAIDADALYAKSLATLARALGR